MSWSSSDDDESAAPAPDDGAEELRQLLVYLYITGTPCTHLKSFERRDGRPIVPGMDRPESKDGKAAWRRFNKNGWRNVGISVQRHRAHPKSHHCHTNSLPPLYSPFEFIRTRRRCQHTCPKLPSWTKAHYESQFHTMTSTSTLTVQHELLKSITCQALIGEAELIQIGGEVDGNSVDLQLRAKTNEAGQLLMSVLGTTISVLRTPRGAFVPGSSNIPPRLHDILSVSKLSGDTPTTSKDAVIPWEYIANFTKVLIRLRSSNAIVQHYARGRLERVRGDGTATETRRHAEQAFSVELASLPPDSYVAISLEFPGLTFIGGALQSKRLSRANQNLISTTHHYEHGLLTDMNGIDDTPYCVGGNDALLAIQGRADSMETEETAEDILSERLKGLRLQGNAGKKEKKKKSNIATPSASGTTPTMPHSSSNKAATTPLISAQKKKKKNPNSSASSAPAKQGNHRPLAPPRPSTRHPMQRGGNYGTPAPPFPSSAPPKQGGNPRTPLTATSVGKPASSAKTSSRATGSVAKSITSSTIAKGAASTSASVASTIAASNVPNSSSKKKKKKNNKKNKKSIPPPTPPPTRPDLHSPLDNMKSGGTFISDGVSFYQLIARGDGNCLPFAILGSNDPRLMEELRAFATHDLVEHPELYTFDAEDIHSLVASGEWTGDILLQIVANTYGLNLNVHSNGEQTIVFQPMAPFEANATGEEIHLLYNGVHYDRLVPRPIEEEVEVEDVVSSSSDDDDENSSSEGEDGSSSDDDEEDSSDSGSDDDDKDDNDSGSDDDDEGGYFQESDVADDAEESEVENMDGDYISNGEEIVDEHHPSIDEMQSGSFDMPTPSARVEEEQPRGSPLERLVSSARSAAAAVIGSFNVSPSSIRGQNLNQRFDDINQNRRRSSRNRKQSKAWDPSNAR